MNSVTPFFSIITVTLNSYEDVILTANNVLEQDFYSYEYIVKDGGSTDNTLEMLAHLGVKTIVAPDLGIYDAMNQALKFASGKYICFLNAGDIFINDSVLMDIYKNIQQNNDPDFIYGDIIVQEPHQYSGEKNRGIKYSSRLSRSYLFRKMICHQAWFVNSEIYKKTNGFKTNYLYSADLDFLLNVILSKKITYYHLPSFLIKYKGNGFTSKSEPRMQKEILYIKRHYYSWYEYYTYKLISTIIHFINLIALYPIFLRFPTSWRGKINGL